jgi:hypothetical protein
MFELNDADSNITDHNEKCLKYLQEEMKKEDLKADDFKVEKYREMDTKLGMVFYKLKVKVEGKHYCLRQLMKSAVNTCL